MGAAEEEAEGDGGEGERGEGGKEEEEEVGCWSMMDSRVTPELRRGRYDSYTLSNGLTGKIKTFF